MSFSNPESSITPTWFFVVCHAFLQLAQLLVSGYLKGSISTLEKRFGLSSQMSGLIVSSNEIGNTSLIVFMSYFGSRVHRPRFIGCGALLVCLAGLIMALPHFVVGQYDYDKSYSSKSSNKTDICQLTETSKFPDEVCNKSAMKGIQTVHAFLFIGQILLGIGGVPIQPFGISYIDDFAAKNNSPLYLGILFAVTVLGPGIAFMLGSVMLRYYVDFDRMKSEDILLKPSDPQWVGAWWMGFLVASSLVLIASIPYFFFPKKMVKEPQEQRRLILVAALGKCLGIPERKGSELKVSPKKRTQGLEASYFLPPHTIEDQVADAEDSSSVPELPPEKKLLGSKLSTSNLSSTQTLPLLPSAEMKEFPGAVFRQKSKIALRVKEGKTSKVSQSEFKRKEDTEDLSLAEFIKTFPKVLLRIVRQPVCVLIILGQLSMAGMVTGIATFMAKFLERQFSLTASVANLIIGAVNIPGAMIGIVTGGILMRKFQMTLKEAAALCTLGLFMCIILSFPLLFLGCSTQDFRSPNITYKNKRTEKYDLSACYKNCNCPKMAYNPICGSDGFEYMSPCYAGCKAFSIKPAERKVQNYTQCSCIKNVDQTEGFAKPGVCDSQCYHSHLLPFVALSLLTGILACTSHTPSFIIILRTVQSEDKSVAVGLQLMILRALGWLPGPVIYGTIIDSTCLVWKKKCEEKKSCLYYDNDLFRFRYIGLQVVYQIIAFVCYLGVYLIFRQQKKKEAPTLDEENDSSMEKADSKRESSNAHKAEPTQDSNTQRKDSKTLLKDSKTQFKD
uniref:Solute carrier organic anion transporter family member n=1 Tax=Geotrypetes seraphini TaxID=260995 RepID=A0A6P8R5G9_GEOSA|nr:solute carrier organic anion transporter family member 2B1 isoform X2 [Geotrypetes seraphini]